MGLFARSGKMNQVWQYDAKAPLVSAAATALIQGSHCVIFGTKNGEVHCIDDAGAMRWRFNPDEKLGKVEEFFVDTERVHSIDAAPIVADVDMDGKQEVIFGTELGTLYCISLEGKLLWKHECGGSIRASACVADINNDGHPEILVGAGNKLVVLKGTGQKLFEYMSESPIESVPGVLKGRKHILIIFGNNNGTLCAITPAQDQVWRLELSQKISAAPAFFQDPEEARLVIGTLGGELVCVSEHGEHIWTFKTRGSIYNMAAVTDINGDKRPEIVVGSCDNTVYALTTEGQRIWSYETDFWITATPLIADINNDGKLEVIAGSYDHNVYILDSLGTYVLDYVPGISGIVTQAGHYSNLLTSDPGEQTGKKLYQYRTNGIIVGCTIIAKEKPTLIVSTKAGIITGLRHE